MANNPKVPLSGEPIASVNLLTNRIWYKFFEDVVNFVNEESNKSWTTSDRPLNPDAGKVGYNTTSSKFEGYDGTNWVNLN